MTGRAVKTSHSISSTELSRDGHGFIVHPQHLRRSKEYAFIYKEEEAERSVKWANFLRSYGEFVPLSEKSVSVDSESVTFAEEWAAQTVNEVIVGNENEDETSSVGLRRLETWENVRTSLWPVERALCSRFKKSSDAATNGFFGATSQSGAEVEPFKAASPSRYTTEGSEDESDEVFYDVERSDVVQDGIHSSSDISSEGPTSAEQGDESCPWKEELDALVQGGVPMALRGELWQIFVGTGIRRVQGHYQKLLALLADGNSTGSAFSGTTTNHSLSESDDLEKCISQIEKDLPRTFPGHPALDENGRNTLCRLLKAYALHNRDVGYCQAMNFLAALLLMMMPEEDAFWTLDAIIDDYFRGYFSEKMLEFQVDQLVLEDLACMHFPRLVTHLDNVGVKVAWISGPWFLSIFINILPWESVLRVWDVLLYEGNRSMVFRTTLALLELHGSAVMASKDTGDAMTLLQSLAGGTFDSSELVLMAGMGYRSVTESMLLDLHSKHHPQVLASLSERSIKQSSYPNMSNFSKLYNNDISRKAFSSQQFESGERKTANGRSIPGAASDQSFCNDALLVNGKISFSCAGEVSPLLLKEQFQDRVLFDATRVTDLVDQVRRLKLDLSRVLEERRVATLRADEAEIAFMELVKEDNRRLLSAKVETLEAEVAQLRQVIAHKEEQEQVMVQMILRMEHEQQSAEAARQFAEEDAEVQGHAARVLQAKYDGVIISLKDMEKRAVKAETMLKSTLQYQTLDNNHVPSSQRDVDPASAFEEEPSRWSWQHILSKTADSYGSIGSSISRKLNGIDHTSEKMNMKSTDSQFDIPPQRQGLLSRRFSLSWHEKP